MYQDQQRKLQLEALRSAKANDPARFADLEVTPQVQTHDLYRPGAHDHNRGKAAASVPAWSEGDREYYRRGKLAALRLAAARDPGRFGALAEAAGKEGGDVEGAYRELMKAAEV
jgi:hypothetical protein